MTHEQLRSRLREQALMLRKSRSIAEKQKFGDYCTADVYTHVVIHHHRDLEQIVREVVRAA